ncbi:MAG: nucleotidyltransferase domain-containing protein, partial [Bacteroidales bacterium]|nr:nucleotidyltransferase domain-containing protein [Bacteroidales bacterium]
MTSDQVLTQIKNIADSTLPAGSSLWLYGSRARGDARDDSDWDLLLLLDKKTITLEDIDLSYPFRELGWRINEDISTHVYSKSQWASW